MSHVTNFAGVLIPENRLDVLKEAVAKTCPQLEFVEGQTHYRTWKDDHQGRLVGDWPVPAGMTSSTVGDNAEHIIRAKPSSKLSSSRPYDIGVVRGDYDRDAEGNILTDAQGNPTGVHADPESSTYMLVADFYNQGNGILNAEGVGKSRYDYEKGKKGATAFDDLYQTYQAVLDAHVAAEQGDSIEFFEENGLLYSVKQTQARLGVA